MRSAIWATCAFALFLCGCFNPHVKNGGFACSTTDPDPCPQGFFCVAGVCQDQPGGGGGNGGGVGGVGTPDLASSSVGDMGGPARDFGGGPGGAQDMTTLPDLEPPPDMTMCKQAGSVCSSSSSCCSGTCFVFLCT